MDQQKIEYYSTLLALEALSIAYKEEKSKDINEQEFSYIGRNLRWKILKRDSFRCIYCGKGPDDGMKLHIDHIYPASKGGKDTKNNLVTSCEPCNLAKSAEIMSDELLRNIQIQVKKRNESYTVNT